MAKRVGIVGIYQTKYEAAKSDQSLEELIYHTVTSLLHETGIGIKDVESIVTSSSDQIDGMAISMMCTAGAAGAEMKDLINSSGAGEHALILAYLRILSGVFDNSLVVNWTKCSEIQLPKIENLSTDPFYERDIGLTNLIANSLAAGAYIRKYKPRAELVAEIVKKNRRNAMKNPSAHLQEEVTTKEVLGSKILSWPLRELEVPPESDGACAMFLASEETARSFGKPVAWITGVDWAADTYWLGDRDLSELTSVSIAARKAYEMAGIKDPRKEIDVAEVYDVSAYHELMAYEALGFCGKGEGASLVEKGVTGAEGSLPVNLSGGVLSSNPVFASGLVRVVEAALQVMGQAQGRQIEKARKAVAQASSGFASQCSSVFVLEKE